MMLQLVAPIAVRWTVMDELAALVRSGAHPYRLRLVPQGQHSAWVELLVLPPDTAAVQPADDCCHVCTCPVPPAS